MDLWSMEMAIHSKTTSYHHSYLRNKNLPNSVTFVAAVVMLLQSLWTANCSLSVTLMEANWAYSSM